MRLVNGGLALSFPMAVQRQRVPCRTARGCAAGNDSAPRSSWWSPSYVDAIQPPFNLIHCDDDVLLKAREHEAGVIVYSLMASGLLTGALIAARAARLEPADWRVDRPDSVLRQQRDRAHCATQDLPGRTGQRAGTHGPVGTAQLRVRTRYRAAQWLRRYPGGGKLDHQGTPRA